jgi:hypothetical protein
VFPFALAWNRAVAAATPASLTTLLQKYFESGATRGRLPELQVEEAAGLGFGVTILLGLSLGAILFRRCKHDTPQGARCENPVSRMVCIAPWLSLLYLMSKWNLTGAERILAPYYPLLCMGLLLSPAHAGLIRRRWWRGWATFSCVLAVLLLILSPARPLWPAGWLVRHYGPQLKSNRWVARAIDAYETKNQRAEVFAPVVAMLPADATMLGFSAYDFPEASLWKPFGSRRVLHVKMSDSADAVRQRGLKYLLVTLGTSDDSWPQWAQRMDVKELQAVPLKMWGSQPPFVWHLVELNPHPPGQSKPQPEPSQGNGV